MNSSFMRFCGLLIAGLMMMLQPMTAAAQGLKKLKITIPVAAVNFYPLYAAVDQGIFAREGYDVEIVATAGDGPDVDALIAGSVEFSLSTPNRLMTANERGLSLWAVLNTVNRMAIECIINKAFAERSGLKPETPLEAKLKALDGQTIAGTRPGSFTFLTAVRYITRVGLEPQKNVKVIGVGGASSMLAALENEQIVVACTASPTPEMAEVRGKSYQFTRNLEGGDPAYDDFLYHVLYVRPDYAKQNPEIVRGVVRALLAATAYIQDTPGDKQLPGLRSRFPGLDDQILLTMLKNNQPSYNRTGVITEASVAKAAAFLRDTGVIKSAPDWKAITTNDYLPSSKKP